MVHIIGIPNCNKIRNTKNWLTNQRIDHVLINVKKDPLTYDELKELELKVGLDVLVNTKGTTYRTLNIKDLNLSDEKLFDLLLEHQSMITRPIIVYRDSVLVGYDEKAFKAFFKENELMED